MEKLRILIEMTINYSKKIFTNTYEDKPAIHRSPPLRYNIPRIKKFRKSTSQTDLDKIQTTTTEEDWGWFVDPKDVLR